ncbi:MAG TPA: 2-oxo acid dehydrogenase subunit E2 [Streptosporangiaceae bacterium]|jgi:pyruvate dehydrogenase E2 component (dihydrolipoyllysine-residue acetyltransferase)|nr:2-oxo acid dehydrogenase subunit E2 [Streptosporangiaceae bacterium]
MTEVSVPDLGDFADVPVIEIHVAPGDVVSNEDPLVTLESDKATMDIPSPAAGTVRELRVKVGDLVSRGSPILSLDTEGAAVEPPPLTDQQEPPTLDAADPVEAAREPAARSTAEAPVPGATAGAGEVGAAAGASAPAGAGAGAEALADFDGVHASPGVRRLARELDLDLTALSGTGPKGRITKEDVIAGVRGPAAAGAGPATAGAGIPEVPAQDFSKFGPVEVRPLTRIQRLSGPALHRSWLNVPHVTHDDEADITDLDAYRRELDTAAKAEGYRVTLLAFLMKASVSALREFPRFNSSLTPEKDALIYKGYYHLGVAVDTPEGLVVPVIRDVDRKGITELSKELGATSARAREGKLGPADLRGASFTISSLGGIGGTSFTPIVNAPEVAILGVVRSKMAPVWDGEAFVPRLMLPLSLSYDHRVIDGALAARFARYLCGVLEDIRRLVL